MVIIGGSAGGIQTAICAQKHHGLKDILVIRVEEKAMVPCGTPYIIDPHTKVLFWIAQCDELLLPAIINF